MSRDRSRTHCVLETRELLFKSPCEGQKKLVLCGGTPVDRQMFISWGDTGELWSPSNFQASGPPQPAPQTPSWVQAQPPAAQMVCVQGMQNDALAKHLAR